MRHLLRPPLGQDRHRLRADGRVLVELKTAWRDGTTHLLFEPMEFLGRPAALTPRPAINLPRSRWVVAPRAPWRRQAVGYAREALAPATVGPAEAAPRSARHPGPPAPRDWS